MGQGLNMYFSGLVLSAKKRFRGNVGTNVSSRFVVLPAPLSLRKFRCIGRCALAHNKAHQFAAFGCRTFTTAHTRLRSGRCARRYVLRSYADNILILLNCHKDFA
jgi:hypothetical protein